MLRVLNCYVGQCLRPETYRALVNNVPIGSLEMINVAGNVSRYWSEFRKRWVGKYDLMTVEQDNVITPDMIPSFNMCDQPWCVYAYDGPFHMDDRTIKTGLGCTRFSAGLQREIPVEMIHDKDYFTWNLLDYRIAIVLTDHGYEPHVHGRVQHLHGYSDDDSFNEKQKTIIHLNTIDVPDDAITLMKQAA